MDRRQWLIGSAAAAMVGVGAIEYGVDRAKAAAEYTAIAAAIRERVSARPELKDLVRFATLAANGHNTQPWRCRLGNGRIDIRPDFAVEVPLCEQIRYGRAENARQPR